MKYFISITCSLLFLVTVQAQTPEEKIKELGITLPTVSKPISNYLSYKKIGDLIYLSGVTSQKKGKLGDDLNTEQGYQIAKTTGFQILAILKQCIGDLQNIEEFIRVQGMISSTSEFYNQSQVLNGFSDLIIEIFGEKGKHTRIASGQISLSNNSALEICVIVKVKS